MKTNGLFAPLRGRLRKRTETVLDFSQHKSGYVSTPQGKKLAERGISAANLAKVSDTSLPDVSNYLHRHFNKIGTKNRRQIFAALCQLGIAKKRIMKPPVCKNCGIAYPTRKGFPPTGNSVKNC